jgi:hypothetical protein
MTGGSPASGVVARHWPVRSVTGVGGIGVGSEHAAHSAQITNNSEALTSFIETFPATCVWYAAIN